MQANWTWKVSSLNHRQGPAVLSIWWLLSGSFEQNSQPASCCYGKIPRVHTCWLSCARTGSHMHWADGFPSSCQFFRGYQFCKDREYSVCILFLPASISHLPLFSKSAPSFSASCSGLWLVVAVSCDYCRSTMYILITLIGWELAHEPNLTSWNQQDSIPALLFELQGNGSSFWLEVNRQRGRSRSCW